MRTPHLTIVFAFAWAAFAAAPQGVPAGTPHVYKSVAGRELKLYVLPSEKGGGPSPAIVFFHGGGWVGGPPNQFDRQAARLASLGMIAVQVEYRLIPKDGTAPPAVCIEDAKSAMRWVRSHAKQLNIDPDRIASAGGSAGGHLAAVVGMMDGMDDPADDRTVSPKSNAMLLFNPVFDNGPGGYGHNLVGDRYREFSPYHNVTASMPPAIVFVGSEDALLPAATVKSFCEKARAAGARCEYHIYEGQKHGFFNLKPSVENRDGEDALKRSEAFLASLGWIAP